MNCSNKFDTDIYAWMTTGNRSKYMRTVRWSIYLPWLERGLSLHPAQKPFYLMLVYKHVIVDSSHCIVCRLGVPDLEFAHYIYRLALKKFQDTDQCIFDDVSLTRHVCYEKESLGKELFFGQTCMSERRVGSRAAGASGNLYHVLVLLSDLF